MSERKFFESLEDIQFMEGNASGEGPQVRDGVVIAEPVFQFANGH
jgi:hypothetical protein